MLSAFESEPPSIAALAQLLPKCQQLLHVKDVAPQLLSRGTLTSREYEELGLGAGVQIYSQAAMAERLVMVLLKKPGGGAEQLLWALERTLEGDSPQTSHRELADMLRKCSQQRGTDEPERDKVMDCATSSPPWKSGEPSHLIRYEHVQNAEKLRVALVTESRRIKEEYSTFVYQTSELLLSKNVSVDKVQLALYSRLGIESVDERLLAKVEEAKSIPSVLRAALPFSSWYNYDLISHLIKLLVGAEGEALVKSYEDKLQTYFKKLIYECPPFSCLDEFPEEFEELVVKLDWDFQKCTVQDITIFKEKLCTLLNQPDPGLFILKSIDEGCVEITWVIPPVIQRDVYSEVESVQMKGDKETLRQMGITGLRVGKQDTTVQTLVSVVKKLETQEENVSGSDDSANESPTREQDRVLTPHNIMRRSPNMHRRIVEKRLKFQEKKKDRDSAISIGSPSTGPPSQQHSAADLSSHVSQDPGISSRKDSVDIATCMYVSVEQHDQGTRFETPPNSPLAESGIGLSFQRLKAHQDMDKDTDSDTQSQ